MRCTFPSCPLPPGSTSSVVSHRPSQTPTIRSLERVSLSAPATSRQPHCWRWLLWLGPRNKRRRVEDLVLRHLRADAITADTAARTLLDLPGDPGRMSVAVLSTHSSPAMRGRTRGSSRIWCGRSSSRDYGPPSSLSAERRSGVSDGIRVIAWSSLPRRRGAGGRPAIGAIALRRDESVEPVPDQSSCVSSSTWTLLSSCRIMRVVRAGGRHRHRAAETPSRTCCRPLKGGTDVHSEHVLSPPAPRPPSGG